MRLVGVRPYTFASATCFVALTGTIIAVAAGPGTCAESPNVHNLGAKVSILNQSIAPEQAGNFAQAPRALPSDADPRLTVGVGYDSMTDDVRPSCIVQTEKDLPTAESEGQNGRMLLNYVTSEDDIARSLGVEASASFGIGIFSADAAVQYLSSENMTQYSSYLLVTSANENSKQLLSTYTLNRKAKAALHQGLPEFVKLCGDKFVRGIITGGSISAILSASSSTQKEQIDADATLHAAGWGGSIDAATQQKLQSYESAGRLNVQIIRQGPAEDWPQNDVNALISYARTFPKKVATNSNEAWVISYVLSDYDEIFEKWNAPASQVKFFAVEGPYLRSLYQARNNYEYVSSNPDEFGATSSIKLSKEIASLEAEIGRVKMSANACLSDAEQCSELKHMAVPGAPDRTHPWQDIDPTVNVYRAYYTVIAPDQKVIELKGDYYTQCQNHSAGEFGPTSWGIQFMNIRTGQVLYDNPYPGHPMKAPEDTQVSVRVLDTVPGDNCGVSGDPPQVRLFTPVFPDDY